VLRQEDCLQHLFEGRFSTAGISDVVRQQIPDNGTGDSEGPIQYDKAGYVSCLL